MRKSLGDKRKYISGRQVDEVVFLYSDALHIAEDPSHPMHRRVKIFANDDFGFNRVTVERPLKLRFEVSEASILIAEESRAISNHIDLRKLTEVLKTLFGQKWETKNVAFAHVREAMGQAGLEWSSKAAFLAGMRDVLGVRDPNGEIQMKKDLPEPDPELRDFENIPIAQDQDAYMKREVLPYASDAWIDSDKTKVGYSINFARHFLFVHSTALFSGD
ncbi:hypothetical protein GCM10022223_43420 [Kineosporia mesophila]|uniref:Uncharacterized protein n=1 Tax=Kineosporia mesophila TaxID=566012 RepID=A0ABP6ZZJ6_9ACTN|nr:hypothetical protein [Kineosporia mesophila]MCD5353229.1 hypothetical protein [Kineosporia mesophila]